MKQLEMVKERLLWNSVVYQKLPGFLQVGRTEEDVLSDILEMYEKLSGERPVLQYDLVSGFRAGEIGGLATAKILSAGDSVIVDLLPMVDGVCCDTTRTFFIGEPDELQKKAWSTITEALLHTEKSIVPGISAEEIYALVNEVLAKGGFEDLPHHAGHVTGGDFLLSPEFVPGNREKLEPGMIIALEPGIYQKGAWGIRLENNYLITEDGCRNLFNSSLDIRDFIV